MKDQHSPVGDCSLPSRHSCLESFCLASGRLRPLSNLQSQLRRLFNPRSYNVFGNLYLDVTKGELS